MSFISYQKNEVIFKILYVGPGLSGKTTNIQYIYEQTQQDDRGKLVALSTENERTLFYDLLPLLPHSIPDVGGYKIRFHLFTLPGQTYYKIPRDFIFKGVDGIIFVADSQPERMEANLESFEDLQRSLDQNGYDLARLQIAFQYNKRDLPDAVSLQELQATFNSTHRPYFEAVANRGQGVLETLQSVTMGVIEEFRGGKGR